MVAPFLFNQKFKAAIKPMYKHRTVCHTCFQARSGSMSGHVELTFVTDAARPLDIAGSPEPFARLPGRGPGSPAAVAVRSPGPLGLLLTITFLDQQKKRNNLAFPRTTQ